MVQDGILTYYTQNPDDPPLPFDPQPVDSIIQLLSSLPLCPTLDLKEHSRSAALTKQPVRTTDVKHVWNICSQF